MAFSCSTRRVFPGFVLFSMVILASLSISVTGSHLTGTCSLRIDPITGLGRTMCSNEDIPSLPTFKLPEVYTPLPKASSKSVIVGPTTYYPQRSISPTTRYEKTTSLSQRLCPNDRKPALTSDPNYEGNSVRRVVCLPANAIIKQEGPSFFPRKTQLARWQELRDPFIYTQKHNRPLPTR